MTIPAIQFRPAKPLTTEFELISLENLYQDQSTYAMSVAPHRLKFYNLIYFETGYGEHMIDFKHYPFEPGTMIMVQREQVQSFDLSQRPKGKLLIFTQSFLDDVHANMRLPNFTPTHLNQNYSPNILLPAVERTRCDNLLTEIEAESGLTAPDSQILMHLFACLTLILNRLQQFTSQENLSQSHNQQFARFIDLLFSHYRKTRDANWYAAQMFTTYKTLNKVCKAATGTTAKQLIDKHAILEIQRQLVLDKLTTESLAYNNGFEDSSNFVKYFKKHTSLTPKQFKDKFYLANSDF